MADSSGVVAVPAPVEQGNSDNPSGGVGGTATGGDVAPTNTTATATAVTTTTNQQNNKNKMTSSVVDSCLFSKGRNDICGILCNDASGLCLASKGQLADDVGSAGTSSSSSTGVYTSLTRLASQLQPMVALRRHHQTGGAGIGVGVEGTGPGGVGDGSGSAGIVSNNNEGGGVGNGVVSPASPSVSSPAVGVGGQAQLPPLITIETEQAAILVKEYDNGHTVAMRVPTCYSNPAK